MLGSSLEAVIKGRKFPHDLSWLQLNPCNGSQPGHPHPQDLLSPLCPLSCPPSFRFPLLLAAAGGCPLPASSWGAAQGQFKAFPSKGLPGRLTLATAQGLNQLREENPPSSAQTASACLFHSRYRAGVITNPLTPAPAAGRTFQLCLEGAGSITPCRSRWEL